MLKPASSLCNLRCKYCFYADVANLREVKSFGLMTAEISEQILDHVFAGLAAGDRVNFVFQGGEPTMAGLGYFRHFVEQAEMRNLKRNVKISYALQTNGMALDEEWCGFLKQHRFLVGLSLDGMASSHDACRVDEKGKGTYKRVVASKRLLEHNGVPYNILMTLTSSLARHPQQVWRFLKDQKIQYVQFTPCLAPMGVEPARDSYALTPRRFADFYKSIFRLWLEDWKSGNYISVKLIDDLVHLLADGSVSACGLTGYCSPQMVVEADGGVYPCDFYMLDSYKAGNLSLQSMQEIYEAAAMEEFRRQPRRTALCMECRFQKLCGGGCKRMQAHICYGDGDTYCGYYDFLNETIEELGRVARTI